MLPVNTIAEDIVAHLREGNRLVLTAPTGSGKTTQVPQIVHRAGDAITDKQIVVLQPRRLATRMVARRVAHELKCDVGGLVGYQTRHESHVSRDTRIRFMTEGLFLRLMQSDPTLRYVGCVILDEFHERNLDADVSLALLRQLQDARRPDLRVVVMSATLDAEAVAAYLDCESLHAEGRAYPVDVTYLKKLPSKPVWDLAGEALDGFLNAGRDGDVLVFMPRVFEINRTIRACQAVVSRSGETIDVLPLHGSLPPAEQDRAVGPSKRRKVIVATNVAETSITIDGVTCVIDSGEVQMARYDPDRALNLLRVEPCSRASADQRAGRAGRTAPGVCLRLWTETDHARRDAQTPPEVRRVELAEAVLRLKTMGVADVRGFGWLDRPDDADVDHAIALLRELGAIDGGEEASGADGALTTLGRRMARFPAHPRLARMLLDAADAGCLGRAITWAALIAERDIATRGGAAKLRRFIEPDEPLSDVAVRERALNAARDARFDRHACESIGLHGQTCREVDRAVKQFERLARDMDLPLGGRRAAQATGMTAALLRCVLAAYGDHVAVRLDAQRPHCAMPGRKRVVLDDATVVTEPGPLVALDVREVGRGDGRETVLGLASAVTVDTLIDLHPQRVSQRKRAVWDAERLAVEQADETLYDGVVIDCTQRPDADPAVAAEMLVERITSGELRLERWDDGVEQWLARVRCVAAWFPERGLITYSDDDLRVILHELVDGATRWSQVRDRPVLDALRNALSWDDTQFVEKNAPTRLDLPSGYKMPVTYEAGAPPKGRAKIQQLYGLTDTPRVAAGRVAVTLEILAPNYRPVQVTTDLASFWANMYPELKKELKRRYPKHEWR
ncbi:MAG: ATP-dependent helicase HrpB [Phycisphaera sp.]|nr:ATP-dependent helicase HrpB [Phycisphaera sp.]